MKTVPSTGLWGGAGHMSEMEGENSDCSKQGMRDNLRKQASQRQAGSDGASLCERCSEKEMHL